MAPISETPSGHVIKAPAFKCDNPLGKDIKPPVPDKAFFWALIGSAGSGKTSLMIHLLTSDDCYKKKFDHVHLIAPKSSMASLSEKDNIWSGHPPEKIHNELNWSILDKIEHLAKERIHKKPRENTLLVIDDMAAHLKEKATEQKLRDIVFNRRHIGTSIMILVQSYNAMPLSLRKTLSHFSVFKPRNKKETEAIFEEVIFLSKHAAEDVHRFVYREDHDFLFGICNTGILHRNFNELKIPEQDGEEDTTLTVKDSGSDSE
jgi:KaiC/GvpD/RAD55 family RecA-like ATPase